MQSQKSIEAEERRTEVEKDATKAFMFPNTVLGRKRFRELRYFLKKLNIQVTIPNNDVHATHFYCVQFNDESDQWKYDMLANDRRKS
jgi:hypothetical protein